MYNVIRRSTSFYSINYIPISSSAPIYTVYSRANTINLFNGSRVHGTSLVHSVSMTVSPQCLRSIIYVHASGIVLRITVNREWKSSSERFTFFQNGRLTTSLNIGVLIWSNASVRHIVIFFNRSIVHNTYIHVTMRITQI